MTTEIDLEPFCSAERHRGDLHKPFSIGEYTYASDGKVAIRVGRRADVPEVDSAPKSIVDLFRQVEGLPYTPMPVIVIPYKRPPNCRLCDGLGYVGKCPECNGEGGHGCDCEYCDRQCEECDGDEVVSIKDLPEADRIVCMECSGSGARHDDRDVFFSDGLVLAARFVAMVLALPGPHEMALRRYKYAPQAFRFEGGAVLIMPKNGSKRDDSIIETVSAFSAREQEAP